MLVGPGISRHHARAWEGVPAKSDSIMILHLAPLVFKRIVIHGEEVIAESSTREPRDRKMCKRLPKFGIWLATVSSH